MSAAIITSKGQITIPSDIRRLWKLEAGDSLEFYSDHKGHLSIRPRNASPVAFLDALPARTRLPAFSSDEEAIGAAVVSRNTPAGKRQASE